MPITIAYNPNAGILASSARRIGDRDRALQEREREDRLAQAQFANQMAIEQFTLGAEGQDAEIAMATRRQNAQESQFGQQLAFQEDTQIADRMFQEYMDRLNYDQQVEQFEREAEQRKNEQEVQNMHSMDLRSMAEQHDFDMGNQQARLAMDTYKGRLSEDMYAEWQREEKAMNDITQQILGQNDGLSMDQKMSAIRQEQANINRKRMGIPIDDRPVQPPQEQFDSGRATDEFRNVYARNSRGDWDKLHDQGQIDQRSQERARADYATIYRRLSTMSTENWGEEFGLVEKTGANVKDKADKEYADYIRATQGVLAVPGSSGIPPNLARPAEEGEPSPPAALLSTTGGAPTSAPAVAKALPPPTLSPAVSAALDKIAGPGILGNAKQLAVNTLDATGQGVGDFLGGGYYNMPSFPKNSLSLDKVVPWVLDLLQKKGDVGGLDVSDLQGGTTVSDVFEKAASTYEAAQSGVFNGIGGVADYLNATATGDPLSVNYSKTRKAEAAAGIDELAAAILKMKPGSVEYIDTLKAADSVLSASQYAAVEAKIAPPTPTPPPKPMAEVGPAREELLQRGIRELAAVSGTRDVVRTTKYKIAKAIAKDIRDLGFSLESAKKEIMKKNPHLKKSDLQLIINAFGK